MTSRDSMLRSALVLLAVMLLIGSCSKKEEPAPKAGSQPTEVRKLVDDTKRYAERLKAQPAGGGPAPEQLAKLTAQLDQLLRHMEEKAQVQQQGGDVSKPNEQIAEDLAQLQEVQSTLPAAAGDQGTLPAAGQEAQPTSTGAQATPPAAGQERPPLDMISENLAKITQIVKQGQEIVAVLRPAKGQPSASDSGLGGSSEGTLPAEEAQASDTLQSSTAASTTPVSETTEPSTTPVSETTESSSVASDTPAPVLVAQAGGQAAPVTTGYARVHIDAWPKGRFQLKVNGLLAGQYDSHISTELGPLLKPGAINTITFTFSQPEGTVDLTVMAPGSKQWINILKFVASKERLEDSVQIPFVGEKK